MVVADLNPLHYSWDASIRYAKRDGGADEDGKDDDDKRGDAGDKEHIPTHLRGPRLLLSAS